MAEDIEIVPKSPVASEPAVSPKPGVSSAGESGPPGENGVSQGEGLPDELLQLPAIQAILAGSPAAVSATLADFQTRPEAKLIAMHRNDLMNAGIGFYRALDGQTVAAFNQLYLPAAKLQAADKAGKLAELAPPFDVVAFEISQAGEAHPALSHPGVPTEAPTGDEEAASAAPAPAGVSAPQASAPPPPASTQTSLASARARNLAPGSPTSGAKPGAGRLTNMIMKPVI